MAAWKVAPILAAGNTVVIKPSGQTPLTTLNLAEIVSDLPPVGVLKVVPGRGSVVGARLSQHPDVAMIALPGCSRGGVPDPRGADGPTRARPCPGPDDDPHLGPSRDRLVQDVPARSQSPVGATRPPFGP